MSERGFGFAEAVAETALELPVVQKRVDRAARDASQDVAAESGFHRRAPVKPSAAKDDPLKKGDPPKKAVGRLRLSQIVPLQTPYAGEGRVQLNITIPVPVAEEWRQLVAQSGELQWELLEKAIPLLRENMNLGAPKSRR